MPFAVIALEAIPGGYTRIDGGAVDWGVGLGAGLGAGEGMVLVAVEVWGCSVVA